VYRNPKPCAGVVVVDEGSILLVERTEPPAAGAWSLPAGYLEADEPPRRAATRELREETELRVAPDAIDLVDTVFRPHPDGDFVLVVVYVVEREATDGDPSPGSDAASARFWRLDELSAAGESLEPGYRALFERIVTSSESSTGTSSRGD
jgi:ADP-ribose pyrophosphatase YjhB (NUDIX family)